MTTHNTKNGITKDSTLLININPYLPNNYKQTLNYVGYWKWDSTNQTFIQVLNNQDIIDEKYNLKIQPLFYDADTGLPQKVTVNSGDTKRLKMVNDNNDGSMEPAEYIENNTMVKFNSKTRSVTEYPYFEVEALPPNITTPIENNGYYKFNGNSLISGTNQDYNLNVNVKNKFYITSIIFGSNNENIASSNTNWTYYTTYTYTTFSTGTEVITIYKNTTYNSYTIKLYHNISNNSLYIYDKTWVFTKDVDTYYSSLRFIDENDNFLFSMLDDNSSEISVLYNNDSNQSVINSNIFSFDKISWMTFN